MSNILSQINARNLVVNDFDFSDISLRTASERITEFKADPLVLACRLKRHIEEGNGYLSLESNDLVELITPEDVELAETIRKYYSKKFFWKALADGRSLSDYRTRLINLLENRIDKCKDQDCGIYYKLPWFYQEDMAYEDFKLNYKTESIPRIIYGVKAGPEDFELTYVKSTVSTQRKRKIERFWFTDKTHLYSIEVEQSNPLIDMFRHFLENSNPIKMQGYRSEDRIDQMYFYKIYKFNFTKV